MFFKKSRRFVWKTIKSKTEFLASKLRHVQSSDSAIKKWNQNCLGVFIIKFQQLLQYVVAPVQRMWFWIVILFPVFEKNVYI